MSYWIGIVGLLIGIFSPAASALFLIPATGKIFMENPQLINKFFISWFAVCCFLLIIQYPDRLQSLNLIIGTGISCFLLFVLIKKNYSLDMIFMCMLLLNSAYIALRQFVFFDYISSQYDQAADEAKQIIGSKLVENSEQYHIFIEMVDIFKNYYINYSPGLWISTMMLCLLVGYFFLSRNKEDMLSISLYQNHLYVTYSLVAALAIAIFTNYKVYAINYLLALVPLYLMQGLGVVNEKIGKWFVNSKVLLVIAIGSLIINPYIVLLISVIGLFDNWFDFRDLSKSEDLNENNSN